MKPDRWVRWPENRKENPTLRSEALQRVQVRRRQGASKGNQGTDRNVGIKVKRIQSHGIQRNTIHESENCLEVKQNEV